MKQNKTQCRKQKYLNLTAICVILQGLLVAFQTEQKYEITQCEECDIKILIRKTRKKEKLSV